MFAEGKFGFERPGELKAAGDAGEDESGIVRAEAYRGVEGGFRDGVVLQRDGKLLAEGDQGADDAEQTGDAGGGNGGGRLTLERIGLLDWLGDVCRGGHGREEGTC